MANTGGADARARRGAEQGASRPDCVFCMINAGEIPSEALYRDDDCFAIRDINPIAPTHLLIIPTRHFSELRELGPDAQPLFASVFKAARELAEREGVAETGYRLIANQGSDGGQEVAHFHMHLLGGKRLRGLGLG